MYSSRHTAWGTEKSAKKKGGHTVHPFFKNQFALLMHLAKHATFGVMGLISSS